MRRFFVSVAVVAALSQLAVEPALCQTPDNVLLVVNESSQESVAIGRYYAEKRRIPAANICRIRTSTKEKIGRETYEREIMRPVAQHLRANRLQDQILYIVTTKGIPLIVEGNESLTGDLASVDSELAMLYYYLLLGAYNYYGRFENPYFAVDLNVGDSRPFNRQDYDIYLVTRLTGLSLVDAIFLVDRALSARSDGGFYFDLPSPRESTEGNWLKEAAQKLQAAGLQVTVETSSAALDAISPVQGYCSFQLGASENLPGMQWSPGALALTFEKLSAATFEREHAAADLSGSKLTELLAARFVESGVTGFGGYIADPSPDGYIRPQILLPAYAGGHNLAESFYSAIRYISWRHVVIGDPLAAPFKNSGRARAKAAIETMVKIDNPTGLPEHFSARREAYLVQKYSTSREAIQLLLKAEGLADRGQYSEALETVEQSIERDPHTVEAHWLKAEILERQLNYPLAFDHYEKALELGRRIKSTYLKLVTLALEKLNNPERARPYAQWLFAQFGAKDLEITRLWAEVEFRTGRIEQAKALYYHLVKETSPAPLFALAALGRIFYQEGNLDAASDFLTRALERARQESRPTGGNGSEPVSPEGEHSTEESAALAELLQSIRSAKATSVTLAPEAAPAEQIESVRPARVVSRVPAKYPDQARLQGIEGTVVLSLLIDEMGQMLKAEVQRGHRVLAKAALQAIENWRFEPKLVRGSPQASRLNVTFDFKLKVRD